MVISFSSRCHFKGVKIEMLEILMNFHPFEYNFVMVSNRAKFSIKNSSERNGSITVL